MRQGLRANTPKRREHSTGKGGLPGGLVRDASASCGDPKAGNQIICADNLSALAALGESLKGRVRCIYIDPPYNNRENYHHYRDDLSHGEWLVHMSKRLELMHPLLADDGSLWISIDDNELHYLKVAADRVFGRRNFIATVVWEHRTTRENRRAFSHNHEYVLVYAKDAKRFRESRNRLRPTAEVLARYKNPDHDQRGPWQSVSLNVQDGHATPAQFYEVVGPSGRIHRPPKGRCWVLTKSRMQQEIEAGNVWFGRDGDGVPRLKKFLATAKAGLNPQTLWTADQVGTTDHAKKAALAMFPKREVFATPKPEKLLKRIIEIASDPGDLVLDAYLGSGTTAVVAHKCGRRYVGIEREYPVAMLAAERLRRVIEGTDEPSTLGAGVGGGFSFLRLRSPRQ